MVKHSAYSDEELGLIPDPPDVFDVEPDRRLGYSLAGWFQPYHDDAPPRPAPGERGSIIALDLGHYGPANAPDRIGYRGCTTPDAWHFDGIWKRC